MPNDPSLALRANVSLPPIVLYADHGQRGLRVVLGCHQAIKQGVRLGIPLAEAKGILGTASRTADEPCFLLHQPEVDLAALKQLAAWCGRFSPFVGIEGNDCLLIDLSGCVHLFGGERRLSQRISAAFCAWGLTIRHSIADTVGAAWACARYAKPRERYPSEEIIVPPGQQADALCRLPMHALRLPEPVIEALEELGIDRIEQFLALPRASLPARFGSQILRQWDRALGEIEELIEPIRPCEPLILSVDFDHGMHNREELMQELQRLVSQLTHQLAERQSGLQRLEIQLRLADQSRNSFNTEECRSRLPDGTSQTAQVVARGPARQAGPTYETASTHTLSLEMLRPSQSVSHVMDLLELRLERFSLNAEVVGLRLHAVTIGLLEAHQAQLFDCEDDFKSRRALTRLIDRLRGRLGEERVVHPRLCEDAQPELALCWEPAGTSVSAATQSVVRYRPLRLYQEPFQIQVMSVVPEGPPIRFLWGEQFHTVARYWGPERIETGWWREHPIRRDYYRVETQTGQRFWLFRRRTQEDWYLQGDFE